MLGGGAGFKVQVADPAGGLRVVGVFADEAGAEAWITRDQAAIRSTLMDGPDLAASSRSDRPAHPVDMNRPRPATRRGLFSGVSG